MKKTKQYNTNLEILVKTDQRPEAGDIFVFKPKKYDYYFGLVMNSEIKLLDYFGNISDDDDWDGVLVYIYDQHAPIKNEIPRFRLQKLLVPPLILDVWCWRLGYVENVGRLDIDAVEILPQHCFIEVPLVPERKERYLDEHGRPLARRTEPCGMYGLTPFRGFDDEISRALGIPLAPD